MTVEDMMAVYNLPHYDVQLTFESKIKDEECSIIPPEIEHTLTVNENFEIQCM